ncbi:phospholipase A2 inhibitor and Ly6/PLAUR domain-containing protein-like [Hippoglossus hippoglossus]|uniref:phospholipase A2 inhibitor and Ly6/PLAUR domain-containing protein-like n=1 Tax=Hippoglossus hippoglossus TaxID=8267 RepID=UPI00148B5869|nr:phospholipase A2 inhibitor and Ly6/PLAUR domain-containing protein-like [Hippoglossus hippoglossus]
MMKLLLSLTLIWVLSSTGEALVCETCTNPNCSTTAAVTCVTETMCITASIQAVVIGTPGQQIYKACAPPSLCPSTGSQTFSVNLGDLSSLASATCCSTDSCNSVTLPYPAAPADNSLKCHICSPFTSDCSLSLQCKGTEDRCFQASHYYDYCTDNNNHYPNYNSHCPNYSQCPNYSNHCPNCCCHNHNYYCHHIYNNLDTGSYVYNNPCQALAADAQLAGLQINIDCSSTCSPLDKFELTSHSSYLLLSLLQLI